jgi:hypothetical protein
MEIREAIKSNVVAFPDRKGELGWICGCGGTVWTLFANGDCLCATCECISTVIEVMRRDAAQEMLHEIHMLHNQPCHCKYCYEPSTKPVCGAVGHQIVGICKACGQEQVAHL